MATPRVRPTLLASSDDAEAQFYEALQQGNVELMMSIWADEEEVTCILPGGQCITGIEPLRQLCEGLLANGAVQVVPQQVRRYISASCAVHHVLERVEAKTAQGQQTAYVLATNVYIQTPKGWRMITHHASPGNAQEPADLLPPPTHLH